MERFFRNKKLFAITVVSIFLLFIVLFAGIAAIHHNQFDETVPVSATDPSSSEGESEQEGASSVSSPGISDNSEEEPGTRLLNRKGKPKEMRAVFLYPGVDFTVTGSETEIKESISAAINQAKSLTMNCIVVSLYTEDGDFYSIEGSEKKYDIDILAVAVEEAHRQDMYCYVLFPAALSASGSLTGRIDVNGITFTAKIAGNLAAQYDVDGILIDRYENTAQPDSYARYIDSHTGLGYREYMSLLCDSLIQTIVSSVRQAGPDVQIGFVAEVWENASKNAEGSVTAAQHTALSEGYADTKRWVEEKLVDFVAVRPNGEISNQTEPFQTVVEWWDDVANRAGISLYVLHDAQKADMGQSGFHSPDELTRQVILAKERQAFEGSMFNSLSHLLNNPGGSTDLLMRLYGNQIDTSQILTRLSVKSPEKKSFTTQDKSVEFQGVSDPNFSVTLNGEAIEVLDDGSFTVLKELKALQNEFIFEHKGEQIQFVVTRLDELLRKIEPAGASVSAEGGTKLSVHAVAYIGATVKAQLGAISVELSKDDDSETEDAFAEFTGEITLPAAAAEKQILGVVKVLATYQEISEELEGAEITISPLPAVSVPESSSPEESEPESTDSSSGNETSSEGSSSESAAESGSSEEESPPDREPAGEGDLAVVTGDSAKTFPVSVLNNESNPAYLPLPKGAKDFISGDIKTFTNASGTYQYYHLQSGLRVYADDIEITSGTMSGGNSISSMKISNDGRYTYVTLKTSDAVPYIASMSANTLSFDFQYTTSVPETQADVDSPVISSASWSGSKLTLNLSGLLLGYHAYYESDQKLVIRLTNPHSISGLRIAVDPGHGGKDRGAPGYDSSIDEAMITEEIARRTVDQLQSLGAKVKLIQSDPYLTLTQRIQEAAAFDADILISVHANSSENTAATGSEVYYFYPNGRALAAEASGRISAAMDNTNRGAKQDGYVVITDPRFSSILVETGFISNATECAKLTDAAYQSAIAKGIADAVAAYLGS